MGANGEDAATHPLLGGQESVNVMNEHSCSRDYTLLGVRFEPGATAAGSS
jgi:hypothetical protein